MVSQSLWQSGVLFPSFAPLSHDLRTDVLIIGGGISGILCAHMLSKQGIDCAIPTRIPSANGQRRTACRWTASPILVNIPAARRICAQSYDLHRPSLSTHGLRAEIQSAGAFMGLPLSQLMIHKGRQTDQ